MSQSEKPSKRKRGYVLSAHGLNRLRAVIAQVEMEDNQGQPFLVKELSQRTGLSEATMSRMWSGKARIDHRSLRLVFSAFGLELTEADLQQPDESGSPTRLLGSSTTDGLPNFVSYPSGPVPLGSPLYISRPPIEEQAYHEISQPGSVVRIKAPSGFGKSSLLLRVLNHAGELGYAIASLDLKQADANILADVGAFLRWFCSALSLSLGKTPNLDDYWNEILGHSLSATIFVREHILGPSPSSVLLNLQELNRLFAYPTTAQALFPLLRSWHEEARQDAVWQKLRQVASYATDDYLPLDINQSPFNVGMPLLLPEFTPAQVHTLAERYHLSLTAADFDPLIALVGGNPALVSIAFYHLSQGGLAMATLLRTAAESYGIFHPYLQQLLPKVQDSPERVAQIKSLVMSDDPIPLEPTLAYQLEAAGLVKASNSGWSIRLNLYRDYFRNVLFGGDE